MANRENRNAMRKFRDEMMRIYDMALNCQAEAVNDVEREIVSVTLESLEQHSKSAHEQSMFTYAPLAELKELAS